MREQTPAEELRTAATKLRAYAVMPLEGIEPIHPGDSDEWVKYYGEGHVDLPEGDGRWITLMTPLLAEPLAMLLEDSAKGYEKWAEAVAADFAERIMLPALRVARVINGGEPRA